MIVRRVAQCISCDSKTITRTQIGHKERQEHSFICPNCGIAISYVLDLDQSKGEWKFRNPKNAKWVNSEEGTIKTITFSDEIPIPTDIPEAISPFMSPFIETWGRYEDQDRYREDETLRQIFAHKDFDYLERCRVHFERANWKLFDKELSPRDTAATGATRLRQLYSAYTVLFSKFTLRSRSTRDRIVQRVTYARSCGENLVEELAELYLSSGKIHNLWKEIFSVRRSFINSYNYLQPLLQVKYWKQDYKNIADIALSDKRFSELRQLYIDCFETLCRLPVLAVGFEAIIHHRQLVIPTKKGFMNLEQLESLPNASKVIHISKYPIEDLFVPLLDADFRNGIGHHTAHYEAETDQVVLHSIKGTGKVGRNMSYTEFCEKTLSLFAGFELATMYHHGIHIMVDGRFS